MDRFIEVYCRKYLLGYFKGYEPIIPWKESWTAEKKFGLVLNKIDVILINS